MKEKFILLMLTVLITSCQKGDVPPIKESSPVTENPTMKSNTIEVVLDSVLEDDKSFVKYGKLGNESSKTQTLVSECMGLYKFKEIYRFKYEPYISNGMPFESKLKGKMTMQISKKNRFDETYYESYKCEWFDENYSIKKGKTPEQVLKEASINFKERQ